MCRPFRFHTSCRSIAVLAAEVVARVDSRLVVSDADVATVSPPSREGRAEIGPRPLAIVGKKK